MESERKHTSSDMSVKDEQRTLSESDDDLTRMIGALALDLHVNRPEELSCDLPMPTQCPSPQIETADYRIDRNTVRFSSLEARNRVLAAYTFREKREALADDEQKWLSVARDLWHNEIDHSDSAAGRLLALVHERCDIFALAATAINSESVRVFDVLHAVESALPYLGELPPDGILKLCEAQYELTKNDYASGWFFSKLGNILMNQPDVCRAIHASLRNVATEGTASLHPTALVPLAESFPNDAVGLALEDAESTNAMLRSAALWTLGRLLTLSLVAPDLFSTVSTTLIANMSSSLERVRQTAIRAAARAAYMTNTFDDCLSKLGESGDQVALSAIAEALILNQAEMKGKGNFSDWVRLLCKLSPSFGGALDQFDHVLSRLISDESQQQFAISCFTEWVSANAKDTPRDESVAVLFGSTTSELARRPELLSQVITDWFLSDGMRLAFAAAGLLSHLGVHGLKNAEFSTARLDTLEQGDLLFLARRMVGFVFSEDHLLSLTMSFLKTKDARLRTFGVLQSLFVDELGYDYPFSTIDALESAKAAATEAESKTFFSSAIVAIRNRMNALDALPRLAELNPPPMLQRQFAKARFKQMNEIMEAAQKGSVIRQLVTEIPVKAGVGFFSFHDGAYTDSTQMKALSRSVSLPRRETLDSVGYEMTLFLLRNVKREES